MSISSISYRNLPAGTALVIVGLVFVGLAILISPTRWEVDSRIASTVTRIETSPIFAHCGGADAARACERDGIAIRRLSAGEGSAPVYVIAKDGLDVATVVSGKFYIESSVNDADRQRLRTAFVRSFSR